MNKIEVVVETFAALGEGPHWSQEDKCLYHVDILGQKMHRYDASTGSNISSPKVEGGTLSLIVPVHGSPSQFVIALGRSLHLATWNHTTPTELTLKHIHTVDDDFPTNRFNDGKCDAKGRLWAGTMGYENPKTPTKIELGRGGLYRIDHRGCKRMIDGVDLSNGLDWSQDGKTFFFVDSLKHTVEAFDFDLEEGELSNRRIVFDLRQHAGQEGFLDGMTIDTRGHLWIAVFAGSKVLEVEPCLEGSGGPGKILGSIVFPEAQNITSLAFGGDNCEDLYVTSARTGDPALLKRLSGSLFRVAKLKSLADGQQCRGRPGRAFQMT